MDLDKVKRFSTLFLTALGLFAIIFIIYSLVVITRYAQKKHEIKKDYAGEDLTPSPSPR